MAAPRLSTSRKGQRFLKVAQAHRKRIPQRASRLVAVSINHYSSVTVAGFITYLQSGLRSTSRGVGLIDSFDARKYLRYAFAQKAQATQLAMHGSA